MTEALLMVAQQLISGPHLAADLHRVTHKWCKRSWWSLRQRISSPHPDIYRVTPE